MVRVLLIRHAESSQNEHHAKTSDVLGTAQVLQAMRGASGSEDGDFKLTERGHSQSEMLAALWAPLLEQKAKRGQLHVFCSPMLRCLQTADPLMKRLWGSCGTSATVLPAIMEFGGLTWPSDMNIFDKMAVLRKSGDEAGAMALLKRKHWKPSGLSGDELCKQFPWCVLPETFPRETPWYSGGFEGSTALRRRLTSITNEIIEDYPKRYSEGDVVVFVSHGGTISDLLYSLLVPGHKVRPTNFVEARTQPSFEAVMNTAVTSLLIPGPMHKFGPNPRTSGALEGFSAKLEFLNNVSHLGADRLHGWASDNGLFAVSKI